MPPADSGPAPRGLALYLGVMQFLLLATWTVYAIFLPGLLETVGIGRQWTGWVLLGDQILFACFDIAAGFAAERAFRFHARIGPWVAALGALSCVAFLLLPWLPGLGAGPGIFLGLTALWVISSAALRAPLFGLLARHAARPAVPRLAGLALLGMGVAAALAPYLGTLLTGTDPRLPFALSSLTLLLTAVGVIRAERRGIPAAAAPPENAPAPGIPPAWIFLPALWLIASAMQIAILLLAGPRYLRDAPPDWLPWLLPVFWIGFSLAVFVAGPTSPRWGTARVFGIGALLGGGGIGLTILPGLASAVAGHAIAGLGWGATLACAFGLAAERGRPGRAAILTGLLFAVLAGAAMQRIGISLAGWPARPDLAPLLSGLALAGWLAGGLLVLLAARGTSPPASRTDRDAGSRGSGG